MTQQQPNTDDRFLLIEGRLAAMELKHRELERARNAQETRDISLLARIDGFIDDLRRVERIQMRSFDTLMQTQQEQAADTRALKELQQQTQTTMATLVSIVEKQEKNVVVLADTAKDHKAAIESLAGQVRELAVGQRQMIELLMGWSRTRD